jgi:hypothetical protein
MKWKNHVEIAKAIAQALDLPPELASVLVEGSIQPDKEADKIIRIGRRKTLYRARMAHHKADRRFVMRLIWKARKARLEDRGRDAVWCLGRAIHYIEDLSVATGPFGLSHDVREKDLARCKVSQAAISTGVRSSVNSPHFVWGCVRSLSSYPEPSEALYHASMYAAAISISVLGDVQPPRRLVAELRRARRRHWLIILPSAMMAALAFGGLALTLEPLLVLVAPFIFALILLADREHAYLKVEGRWFGLEA